MNQNNIIPASLAIISMRDSGYKTAAHAIAELIDNSIQAKATNVQLICLDKSVMSSAKKRMKYVDSLGIFDNGKGMRPELLQQALQFGGGSHRNDPNGIGRFGMGLPSATISQCRRLDVYSWVAGECYHTFLDIDQIESGELSTVPDPVAKPIPELWQEAIGEELSTSGTLAVWSDLDRVSWKTSKSIYIHSEKLIGRMYRHFIANNQINVRFKSFTNDVGLIKVRDELFKANDPLFLYKNTILDELPGNYKNESFFEQYGEDEKIPVTMNDGCSGVVTIKYSRVVKTIHQAIREQSSVPVGSTPYGKLASQNNGVSIVRSNREIKLSEIFDNNDLRERYYGVEVSFPPSLDELFGVTFDKQDVVNFELIDLKVEADNEGYNSEDNKEFNEFKDNFEKEQSDRYWIHKITKAIQKNITELRQHTTKLSDSKKKDATSNDGAVPLTHAEEISKKVAEERIKTNKATDSDMDFKSIPNFEKENKISGVLVEKGGLSQTEATEVAKTLIKSDCNVKFLEQPLSGNVFFDVSRQAGSIIVLLNTNHEFYKFYDGVDDTQKELLKLIIIAWAQCEDDCSSSTRADMEDIRSSWGKMMKKYLYELTES